MGGKDLSPLCCPVYWDSAHPFVIKQNKRHENYQRNIATRLVWVGLVGMGGVNRRQLSTRCFDRAPIAGALDRGLDRRYIRSARAAAR